MLINFIDIEIIKSDWLGILREHNKDLEVLIPANLADLIKDSNSLEIID